MSATKARSVLSAASQLIRSRPLCWALRRVERPVSEIGPDGLWGTVHGRRRQWARSRGQIRETARQRPDSLNRPRWVSGKPESTIVRAPAGRVSSGSSGMTRSARPHRSYSKRSPSSADTRACREVALLLCSASTKPPFSIGNKASRSDGGNRKRPRLMRSWRASEPEIRSLRDPSGRLSGYG
jgi:hypothetical protein